MKGMSQNSKAWNFQCTLVGLFGQNVLDIIVDSFVKTLTPSLLGSGVA